MSKDALVSPVTEDGWFAESEVMWPGQKFALQLDTSVGVRGVLHHSRSLFQEVLVLQTVEYGRALVLDGVIQLTERDEFAYQEMIVHLPMFAHARPKRVLIVGGGDGGVLREVVRHTCVEAIDMCEIDAQVIAVAKEFFGGTLATAYGDARLTLVNDDAAKFLERGAAAAAAGAAHGGADGGAGYDVIIVDSSDPVGPAESLFKPAFYASLKAALNPGGIVCTQGECMWLHLPLIASVVAACGRLFPTVEYAYTTVPTYPSGQIGFVLCSLDGAHGACRAPARAPDRATQAALRYYSPRVHEAAFVLPHFAQTALDDARAKGGLAARAAAAASPVVAAAREQGLLRPAVALACAAAALGGYLAARRAPR